MLLSNDDRDLIQQADRDNHNIQRYQFKSIDSVEASIDEAPVNQTFQDDSNLSSVTNNAFERELIEKLLQKTDELSSSLAKMQIQVEKQQLDMEERISLVKNDAYKDGLKEGENLTKAALSQEIDKEKQSLVSAIIALDNSLQNSTKRLEELERELAQIAVDIAREVIIKEVSENSQKVAESLAKSLIENIQDITEARLCVNPMDYSYLREKLDLKNIILEANENISKGGVMITSPSGNIDGNIMTRFKLLKQKALEES